MKRLTMVLLSLAMALSLAVPALAADVKPVPPSWIRAEDYLTFPGDEVYRKENWETITRLRKSAERGDPMPADQMQWPDAEMSAGTCFELGLIRLRYAANGTDPKAFQYADFAFSSASDNYLKSTGYQYDQKNALLGIWANRCYTVYMPANRIFGQNIATQLRWLKREPQSFFDFFFADWVSEDTRAVVEQQIRAAFHPVYVYLDGAKMEFSGILPEIVNGRTMVLAAPVAQHLGARVFYDEESGKVTMIRAGHTVTMTPGETTAWVDGQAVEMDTAPVDVGGYTVVPLRYLGELFGQSVQWNAAKGGADITENKSAVGQSNLEAWALPMGAVLSRLDIGDPARFGLWRRGSVLSGGGGYTQAPTSPVGQARMILERSWGITTREQLIQTAYSLSRQRGSVSCFDLFRVSSLAQWGYTAGYLTYPEALALVEPAAQCLKKNFTSWDAAYENYLRGYYSWSGESLAGKSVWDTPRGNIYQALKTGEETKALFDDAIFKTPVKGVPGLTAESLLASVQ